MKHVSLAVATIAMATGSAQAQESGAATSAAAAAPTQTVEKAQEFLRLISQQFELVSHLLAPDNYYRSINIRFEPSGPCTTKVTRKFEWRLGGAQSSPELDAEANFEALVAQWNQAYPSQDAAAVEAYRKGFLPFLVPTEINWSSVSSVKRYKAHHNETADRAVVIQTDRGIAVVPPDEATAARVAYAMEFLRSACDISASTGF